MKLFKAKNTEVITQTKYFKDFWCNRNFETFFKDYHLNKNFGTIKSISIDGVNEKALLSYLNKHLPKEDHYFYDSLSDAISKYAIDFGDQILTAIIKVDIKMKGAKRLSIKQGDIHNIAIYKRTMEIKIMEMSDSEEINLYDCKGV